MTFLYDYYYHVIVTSNERATGRAAHTTTACTQLLGTSHGKQFTIRGCGHQTWIVNYYPWCEQPKRQQFLLSSSPQYQKRCFAYHKAPRPDSQALGQWRSAGVVVQVMY